MLNLLPLLLLRLLLPRSQLLAATCTASTSPVPLRPAPLPLQDHCLGSGTPRAVGAGCDRPQGVRAGEMLSALRGADGGVRVLVSAAWVKHGAASLESST